MPSRVAAVFCLCLVAWSAGCRKSLAPTSLADRPPETWIVAAPQDTITERDSQGNPIPPTVGRIPVRFHMYWAGSDQDGAVVGFYWAVVETLAVPPVDGGTVPPLPGPKARDYHFTTRTDSTFIFTTSEDVNERQHAFFIYAVDDRGRSDPTPARFVFSAYDRFPPRAVIDECRADGKEYRLPAPVTEFHNTYFVTDFFEISNEHAFPRDTVMSNAQLHIRWHAEATSPNNVVTGYRYKLDETNFNTVDSSVHEVSYNTGRGQDRITAGVKKFTLQAIGRSGWRGEATRWFQMNFAPDTWFAGPDPNDPRAGWNTYSDGHGKRYWYMDFGNLSWKDAFHGIPGTMMSVDSAFTLAAARPERKTFLEAYGQRLWLRQEDDTVHMNSWVIVPGGGFDKDSPFAVFSNMQIFGDSLKAYPVLNPGPPNGSPIGFRIRVQVKDVTGQATMPSETPTYPVVDPASFLDRRAINGYQALTTAGRAYAVLRAVDGNGTVDRRVDQQPGDGVGIVDRCEGGSSSPADRALRSKVLTFYVDHAPVLQQNAQAFFPKPGATLPRDISGGSAFNLPATDDDPVGSAIGGPGTEPTLRWKIAIFGRIVVAGGTCPQDTCYKDTCYIVPAEFPHPSPISFQIPDWLVAGDITVRVRLCDCLECDVLPGTRTCPFVGREVSPGQGRCVDVDIPCRLGPPKAAVDRPFGR